MRPSPRAILVGANTNVSRKRKMIYFLVDHVYAVVKDIPELSVNPDEIAETKYVCENELERLIREDDGLHTPWFKEICKQYFIGPQSMWHKLKSKAQNPAYPLQPIPGIVKCPKPL